MPELPEVETVRRGLLRELKGRVIRDICVYYEGIIEYPGILDFKREIRGQIIHDINRYGKWLMFVLDDYYLLSHLRMEGKYFIKESKDGLNKHEHVVFHLDNDRELRYMDVRKFGKMHLIKKESIDKIGPLLELGLEPWDEKLDVTYVKNKYKKKRLPIKSVLLDQQIVVGIGNIYADEILFLSGIHPLKRAMDLSDLEIGNIIKYTREVMDKAIMDGGTTIRSYGSLNGKEGTHQQELFVHCKEGENCAKCGNEILKIKVGGRGTYYCDTCQKI